MYRHYDHELDREDVAVRAIWLLYRRRHWSLLAEVGISHDHAAALETATTDFDCKLSDADVKALLKTCPFVRGAAQELRQSYRLATLLSYLEQTKETTHDDNYTPVYQE